MSHTQFLALSDIPIAYTEHGSGPNLVLLHGNSLDKSIFHHWQTGFLSGFHTFAIDSRGHGETVSEDERYSYEQFADDTIRFCETIGISEAFFIGYSDGANVGLFLGKKAPHLFSRMFLISPEYTPDGTLFLPRLGMIFLRTIFAGLALIGIDSRWVKRFDLMLHDFDLTIDDLRVVSNEVVIAYAQFDVIRESHLLEIHDAIPGALLLKVMKCGHMSILLKHELRLGIEKFFAMSNAIKS